MSFDVAFGYGIANRRRKIHERDAEISGARIVCARPEARWRQLDKRNMLADGDRLGDWRHGTNPRPGFTFSCERERSFDFSVPGKVFRVGEIESAARRIQTKLTLLIALQRAGNSMSIAQIESSGVNQRAIAFFGGN